MEAMQEWNAIIRIVDRAERIGIGRGTRITRMMDIQNAHKQFNLRLDDMLAADDFDFAHDFIGIQANMNRLSGRIENLFVPRYAGHKEKEDERHEG